MPAWRAEEAGGSPGALTVEVGGPEGDWVLILSYSVSCIVFQQG